MEQAVAPLHSEQVYYSCEVYQLSHLKDFMKEFDRSYMLPFGRIGMHEVIVCYLLTEFKSHSTLKIQVM